MLLAKEAVRAAGARSPMKPTPSAASIHRPHPSRTRRQTPAKTTEKRPGRPLTRASRRRAERRALERSQSAFEGVPSIELFQNEEDPHSHSVRERLSLLGLDFIAHTVSSGDSQ